jgi:hypothetical protein
MPKEVIKTDKRLIGTWLSDRQRTLKELRYRPGLSRKSRRWLRASYGYLRLTYTRREIRTVLKEFRSRDPYEVLASNSGSVAIRWLCKLTNEWDIRHIHFDGPDHYWVCYGYHREWFKRIHEAKG